MIPGANTDFLPIGSLADNSSRAVRNQFTTQFEKKRISNASEGLKHFENSSSNKYEDENSEVIRDIKEENICIDATNQENQEESEIFSDAVLQKPANRNFNEISDSPSNSDDYEDYWNAFKDCKKV